MSFKKCIKKGVASLVLGAMLVSCVGNVNAYAWDRADHETAIDYGNNKAKLNATDIKIIKIAQREADLGSNEGGFFRNENNCFHGHMDFVSTYVYLMTIAHKCRDNKNFGLYELDTQVYHPAGDGTNTFYNVVVTMRALFANDSKEFKKILKRNNITDNARNRGAFIAGLAIHTGQDAYCHVAYEYKGNGVYEAVPKDKRHTVSYVPNRYKSTQEFSANALVDWKGSTNNAKAFWLTGIHHINSNAADGQKGFQLQNFGKGVARNTKNEDFKAWANKRSKVVN